MPFDPSFDHLSVGDQVVVQFGHDEPRTGEVTRIGANEFWVKGKGLKFDGSNRMGVYHGKDTRWMLMKGFLRKVEVAGPAGEGNQL